MQRDSIREWPEQYARCCLNVDFEPSPGAGFCASLKSIFPELHIVRAALSPGFLFRDDDLVRDGDDSFEFIIAQSGELDVTHQGCDFQLAPGDATIMQASATGRGGSRKDFGLVEVLISPTEWETRGCDSYERLTQIIRRDNSGMKLLRGYVAPSEALRSPHQSKGVRSYAVISSISQCLQQLRTSQ